MKKISYTLALFVLLAAALATGLTMPASAARPLLVTYQLPDGTLQSFVIEVPGNATLEDIGSLAPGLPGTPVSAEPLEDHDHGQGGGSQEPPAEQGQEQPGESPEQEPHGEPGREQPADNPDADPEADQPTQPAEAQPLLQTPAAPDALAAPAQPLSPPPLQQLPMVGAEPEKSPADDRVKRLRYEKPEARPRKHGHDTGGAEAPEGPIRRSDGAPIPSNPAFMDALPGPSFRMGVPNFVIRKFRVPVFLLPIYQAAGIEYGIRWEVLAAINEIETDYGRNLNVSTAGAVGWMQFMPSTWAMYGTDGNKDGRKDPYNPVDAIFAAARYLDAAGYSEDVRRAIFAYNHADWYVDSVLLRARLIAGVPADLVGSLTGLTEGRFPVYARAWYADDLAEEAAKGKGAPSPVNVVESNDTRRDVDIFSRQGAPVVAVNDGRVEKLGRSRKLGRFIRIQDVYGNRYTYAHLGEVSKYYPVPREELDRKLGARALRANAHDGHSEPLPRPTLAASAGRQAPIAPEPVPMPSQASVPVKQRLFARPDREGSYEAGGLEQLLDAKARRRGGYETYSNYFARPYGVDPKKVRLTRLRKGSRVIGGTIVGRVGATVAGRAPHVSFSIRPAGRGAPLVDPKPILDGWKLLEATAVYRASGKNALRGRGALSIGQVLMMPKPLLERRVLADARVEVYGCGRADIKAGRVDRRVLAVLAYLAESGMRPTVTSLMCGHSYYTASGNVSHHSSGNAVDIAAINDVPILGHQEPGGITEQAVRRLMQLQGTMRPDQIISLLDFGANTVSMADHADHIHVGFQPNFGANRRLGRQAFAVLRPGQWHDLLARLREIEQPVVPTRPSRWSIPTRKGRKHRHGADD